MAVVAADLTVYVASLWTRANAKATKFFASLVDLIQNYLSIAPIFFTGRNGAGTVAVTGLQVGDVIKLVVGSQVAGGGQLKDFTASFTSPVAVADQLSQTDATDLSAVKLMIFVTRHG